MRKGRFATLVAASAVVGLTASYLSYRKPWVTPLPGVTLARSTPVLLLDDVVPGSPSEQLVAVLLDPMWERHRLALWPALVEQELSPGDSEAMHRALDRLESRYADLQRVLAMGGVRWPAVSSGDHRPDARPVRVPTAWLLALVRLREALLCGDPDRTEGELSDVLELASAMEAGGGLNTWLAARGLRSRAALILADSLASQRPDDATVSRWIELLRTADHDRAPYAEAVRAEAAANLVMDGYPWTYFPLDSDRWPELFGDRPWARLLLGLSRVRGSTPKATSRNHGQLWLELAAMADRFQHPDEITDWLHDRGGEMDWPLTVILAEDPIGLLMASFPLMEVMETAESDWINRKALWAAILGMAAYRYRLATGRPPQFADELDPYLGGIPTSEMMRDLRLAIGDATDDSWTVESIRRHPFRLGDPEDRSWTFRLPP